MPKRLSNKQFALQLGDSGTQIFNGIISGEEYLYSLTGVSLMRVIEEMRRGDPTVAAGLKAIKQPLIGADWFASPASEDAADIDAADLVTKVFTEVLDWQHLLTEILTMLEFGFSVFEIVGDMQFVDGALRWVPTKVAFRKQTTIQAWQQQDGSAGITQVTTSGAGIVSIPDGKLVTFTYQREGDNWQGISALRPAYQPWYFKKELTVIESLQYERQGLGVLSLEAPANATDADINKMIDAARNLRANEQSYILKRPGWIVEFMDMKSKTNADPSAAIDRHDRAILEALQAQFIKIGAAGSSGSYNSSATQRELLVESCEALAAQIGSRISDTLVKLIVDKNFNVSAYPKWVCGDISKENITDFATVYKTLVEARALTPSDADEDHIRKTMRLPEREVVTERKAPAPEKKLEASRRPVPRKIAASISARDIPGLYDGTGVNPDDLGCIMLDVEPLEVLRYIPGDHRDDLLPPTEDGKHKRGAVAERGAHLTLLYGLLENGNTWKDKVDAVLEGWVLDEVEIDEVGYFETSDSFAVIAHVKTTTELIDGHERLTLLPHIQTFSEYRPHVTLAYVSKDADVDDWVDYLGSVYNGKTIKSVGINYGDAPEAGSPKVDASRAPLLTQAIELRHQLEHQLYGPRLAA